MATFVSLNRPLLRVQHSNAAAEQLPAAPAPSGSLAPALFLAARKVLGVVLLLLGILMTFTFILLPVGMPLALLAVALIVAPGDP